MQKKFTVSDKFVEIYSNFNIFLQVDKMRELSRKELLLLLTVTVDSFSLNDSNNEIVISNFLPFEEELQTISRSVFDKDFEDKYFEEISKEIGHNFITVEMLQDRFGENLPEPKTEADIKQIRRGVKIKDILNT